MTPMIAACRDALHRAGYFIQEFSAPNGFRILARRVAANGEGNDVIAFGLNPEQAYHRACLSAHLSVPSLLSIEEPRHGG